MNLVSYMRNSAKILFQIKEKSSKTNPMSDAPMSL